MTSPSHQPSPFVTGLKSRCPRCGEGPLFSGFIKVDKSCTRCGLDYGFADAGDGPAIFIILIAGAIIVCLWAITDVLLRLPVMVHLAIWIPATIILCILLLRPFKATLLALQYRNDAQEGRSDQRED